MELHKFLADFKTHFRSLSQSDFVLYVFSALCGDKDPVNNNADKNCYSWQLPDALRRVNDTNRKLLFKEKTDEKNRLSREAKRHILQKSKDPVPFITYCMSAIIEGERDVIAQQHGVVDYKTGEALFYGIYKQFVEFAKAPADEATDVIRSGVIEYLREHPVESGSALGDATPTELIAFIANEIKKETEDGDKTAIINIAILENKLTAPESWKERVKCHTFKGQLLARGVKISEARMQFERAMCLIEENEPSNENLSKYVKAQLDACESLSFLDLISAADYDFDKYFAKMRELINWCPSKERQMRRLYIYQREDVLKSLLTSYGGAKCVMVSDDKEQILAWKAALGEIFNVSTFIPASALEGEPGEVTTERIPVPSGTEFQRVNKVSLGGGWNGSKWAYTEKTARDRNFTPPASVWEWEGVDYPHLAYDIEPNNGNGAWFLPFNPHDSKKGFEALLRFASILGVIPVISGDLLTAYLSAPTADIKRLNGGGTSVKVPRRGDCSPMKTDLKNYVSALVKSCKSGDWLEKLDDLSERIESAANSSKTLLTTNANILMLEFPFRLWRDGATSRRVHPCIVIPS